MKKAKRNLVINLFILLLCPFIINAQDTVRIGNQVWMAKNLDVVTFRNGDVVPEVITKEQWSKAVDEGLPAWCYYNNDSTYKNKFGKLYNWYAVTDGRGLAPAGWHVPSTSEWVQLATHLKGNIVAGEKMKATLGWNDYQGKSGNGTNESGFAGWPAGYRNYDGSFDGMGTDGHWWSATPYSPYLAWFLFLNNGYTSAGTNFYFKEGGFSVRCIRD